VSKAHNTVFTIGVVDAQLKVYGTANLRVCDASIIPMGLGTHLQSTVYAIAEKVDGFLLLRIQKY